MAEAEAHFAFAGVGDEIIHVFDDDVEELRWPVRGSARDEDGVIILRDERGELRG